MPSTQRRDLWPAVYIALGLLVGVLVYSAGTKFAVEHVAMFLRGRRQDLYAPVIGFEGTMLGFVLTTLTVTLGYAQSPRFEVLRNSPWWTHLFSVFTTALKCLAIALVLALSGLLFDREGSSQLALTSLAAGALVSALGALARLLFILQKVVQVVITDPSRGPRGSG